MIANIIPPNRTHQVSRPQSQNKIYTTFTEFSAEKLLGTGGQNPINAGSSMFNPTSDPNMEPRIRTFIEDHFEKNQYIAKYKCSVNEFAKLASYNLLKFKHDLALRKKIMLDIFEKDSLVLRQDIYSGYVFVVVCYYFMREKSFYRSADKDGLILMKTYFNDENDFWNKIIENLNTQKSIENMNAFCHGRFFFVDDKLSDYNDFKPTQQKIIEIIQEL